MIPPSSTEQATLEDPSTSPSLLDATVDTTNQNSDIEGLLNNTDMMVVTEVDQDLDEEYDMMLPVRQMSRFEISVSPAREVYRIGQELEFKWKI